MPPPHPIECYFGFVSKYTTMMIIIAAIIMMAMRLIIFFWLAWQDAFRTFDWGRVIGDVETMKMEIEHLLSLV